MKFTVSFTFAIAVLLLVWGTGSVAAAQSQPIHITDGPRVEGTSAHTAVIAWTTNARGSTIVHYGTNPNSLNQTAESPYTQQGQTHRVHIKDLQPNTTYYFAVDSGQGFGSGTDSRSAVGQFQTKPLGAAPLGEAAEAGEKPEAVKIVEGPRVEAVGNDWAQVAWTTNEASSSVVHYGMDRNAMTQIAQAPYADTEGANHQTHRVRITNLKPNTTYYFQVDSGQGEGTGTEAKGAIAQFTTK
ncbi:MAG: fibronectin type III domain-containing protein [Terriglobales bacterium]